VIYLRQSTASQEVPLGHFVDDADGKTAETALTINASDIKVWVTGATTLANKNSGGATHISGGVYYCVLDATDTATVGPLVLFVAVAGALAVRVSCVVLAANVYDVWFGSTAPATVSNITGGTITTVTNLTNAPGAGDFTATMKTSIGTAVAASAVASVTGNVGGNVTGSVGSVASGGIVAASFAANAITAAALAADAGTEIAAAVLAAASAAPIAADVKKINATTVNGVGTSGNPWGP